MVTSQRVHVVTNERRYKDKVYRTHLLRRSFRKDGKVKKETVANLTSLGDKIVGIIRSALRGKQTAPVDELFESLRSPHHGHVKAVRTAMRRLGFDKLLSSRPCRERDLVEAMVAARILEPDSKLATTRWWHTTTLPELLNIVDADEEDLYKAMDWLLARQARIENKLAARHLKEEGLVLYDLSSSYFEGVTCPLAELGYPRDGKKGKLQVNFGLLTDERGCPVAVSVFKGNTSDTKTLMPQVKKMKNRFRIKTFVIVGDRGMIAQKQINEDLRDREGVDWITALKNPTIRKLADKGNFQMGLFDERNLFEMTHPDFPNERLVACRNPDLAKRRAHKRQSLLDATKQELEKTRSMIERGKLTGEDKIAARAAKVINKELAEYFKLEIGSNTFSSQVTNRDAAAKAAFENVCKKLDRVSVQVTAAKLIGSKNIAVRLNKIIDKKRAKHFVFDIVDDAFSFRVDNNEAAAQAALESVCDKLEEIRREVHQGKHGGKDNIGARIGKLLNKYKVGKHFVVTIRDDGFDFHINEEKVKAEAALDGIYVVHTSLPAQRLSTDDIVRSYKSLCQVERAFRSIKTVDLKVRPIRHRLETRVKAHIFLCTLAYYVEWYMIEAWRPLLFCDENQEAKSTRDPVAPAKRSEPAMRKVNSRKLDDGTETHSFQTLIKLLSAIVRNVCCVPNQKADPDVPTFYVETTPNAKQRQAYKLLETITV
jgi:transposase